MCRDATGNTKHLKDTLIAMPDRKNRKCTISWTQSDGEILDLGTHVRMCELNSFRGPRRARGVNDSEKIGGLHCAHAIESGMVTRSTKAAALDQKIIEQTHPIFDRFPISDHENDVANV